MWRRDDVCVDPQLWGKYKSTLHKGRIKVAVYFEVYVQHWMKWDRMFRNTLMINEYAHDSYASCRLLALYKMYRIKHFFDKPLVNDYSDIIEQ